MALFELDNVVFYNKNQYNKIKVILEDLEVNSYYIFQVFTNDNDIVNYNFVSSEQDFELEIALPEAKKYAFVLKKEVHNALYVVQKTGYLVPSDLGDVEYNNCVYITGSIKILKQLRIALQNRIYLTGVITLINNLMTKYTNNIVLTGVIKVLRNLLSKFSNTVYLTGNINRLQSLSLVPKPLLQYTQVDQSNWIKYIIYNGIYISNTYLSGSNYIMLLMYESNEGETEAEASQRLSKEMISKCQNVVVKQVYYFSNGTKKEYVDNCSVLDEPPIVRIKTQNNITIYDSNSTHNNRGTPYCYLAIPRKETSYTVCHLYVYFVEISLMLYYSIKGA